MAPKRKAESEEVAKPMADAAVAGKRVTRSGIKRQNVGEAPAKNGNEKSAGTKKVVPTKTVKKTEVEVVASSKEAADKEENGVKQKTPAKSGGDVVMKKSKSTKVDSEAEAASRTIVIEHCKQCNGVPGITALVNPVKDMKRPFNTTVSPCLCSTVVGKYLPLMNQLRVHFTKNRRDYVKFVLLQAVDEFQRKSYETLLRHQEMHKREFMGKTRKRSGKLHSCSFCKRNGFLDKVFLMLNELFQTYNLSLANFIQDIIMGSEKPNYSLMLSREGKMTESMAVRKLKEVKELSDEEFKFAATLMLDYGYRDLFECLTHLEIVDVVKMMMENEDIPRVTDYMNRFRNH